MIVLNVPYEEKEEAKKLGAIWEPEIKKWVAKDRRKYSQLAKWFPVVFFKNGKKNDSYKVIYNYLYIVEKKHKCWNCGKETKVFSFGVKDFYVNPLIGSQLGNKNNILCVKGISPLPKEISDFIKKEYPQYKERYSKSLGKKYMSNGCEYCDSLIGNNNLYDVIDAPFLLNRKNVKNVKLIKIPLKNDLLIESLELCFNNSVDIITCEELEGLEEKYFLNVIEKDLGL